MTVEIQYGGHLARLECGRQWLLCFAAYQRGFLDLIPSPEDHCAEVRVVRRTPAIWFGSQCNHQLIPFTFLTQHRARWQLWPSVGRGSRGEGRDCFIAFFEKTWNHFLLRIQNGWNGAVGERTDHTKEPKLLIWGLWERFCLERSHPAIYTQFAILTNFIDSMSHLRRKAQ